jgi:hypothetical protein
MIERGKTNEMTSEDIFSAALKVIVLVESYTTDTRTAMRIIEAAKQGYGRGFSETESRSKYYSELRESSEAHP